MNPEALPTAEDGYELLDSAEKVQRAFAEGRLIECADPFAEIWSRAVILSYLEAERALQVGVRFRAPKPAEPAEGRMDATVNKLLTDCYKAMTWAMAVIDPDEGPGREHSNASNALADCRVRIENLRALQAGLTKNEFGIPITTPTAERQVGGVGDALPVYARESLDALESWARGYVMADSFDPKVEVNALIQWRRDRELAALAAPANADVRREQDDLLKLQRFAETIMPLDDDFIGSLEGCDIQDAAEACGLLIPTEVTEACGDNCNCAGCGDFPQTCYRPSPTMIRAIKAAATPQEDPTDGR